MTSGDVLSIITGKRHYGGASLATSTMYAQQIPDGFRPIADELRGMLKLLTLTVGVSRKEIYAAYQSDIKLLNTRREGFVQFIKAGIKASIIRAKKDGYVDVTKNVEEQWGNVEKSIPAVGKIPFIALSADDAALAEDKLLTHLQAEANAAVDRLLRLVCLWFDTLVASEFVGLVEFTSPEAGRYHYFRPQVTREIVKQVDEMKQTDFDPSMPFGLRTTWEEQHGTVTRITTSLERHDHDIIDARTDTIENYADRMPQRICDFLAETPAWLRKHLVVVSGTITLERIQRRIVSVNDVDDITVSVYKGSPAIALASYAPAGWSSDDMTKEVTSFFHGQKASSPQARASRHLLFRRILMVLAAVAAFAGGVWWLIDNESQKSAAAYQAYHSTVVGDRQVLTVEKSTVDYVHKAGKPVAVVQSRAITLPGGQPFFYLGKMSMNGQYTFTANANDSWKTGSRATYTLNESHSKSNYGTIDLGPQMGIPAMMHVIYADERVVQFTIEYYAQ